MNKSEYQLLNDFLYGAIFIPEGVSKPPKSIIYTDELQVYVKDFGKFKTDKCFVAEVDNKVVGAVWSRIMNDYGHIDDDTPSLAISIFEKYRRQGIGTALMNRILDSIHNDGFKQVSLSVQSANGAVNLYKKLGFKILNTHDEEYIMIKVL